jgi:SpoVK/Ycf46/Vps4 family AAA+-type ATPase
VLDKWVGNSEKAISMIFGLARKKVPSIIFLDEVDAIGGSRANMQAGWEKKLISQLLIELDGLSSDNRNVMVLGASNAPWEVDFALRRPGRLGRLVFVPPPDAAARADIFKIYLERKPFRDESLNLVELGRLTENYSADAIRQIVENAASIPWRHAIETGEERAISQADLLQAISETPADLAEWTKLVGRYEEFAKQSQTRSSMGFRKGGAKPLANPG